MKEDIIRLLFSGIARLWGKVNFYFPHQTVDAASNSAGGSFACMRRCADRAMPQHIKQFKRMQIPIKKPVSWSDYPAQTERLKARKEEDEWNCAVEVEVSVAVCVCGMAKEFHFSILFEFLARGSISPCAAQRHHHQLTCSWCLSSDQESIIEALCRA